ncbi:MAG: HAD family hydrolase [Litoreibacter sp.]
MKIAMWSGPRNLSTALMYAFGNRSDFEAYDEPFYAAYLAATRHQHPMFAEILRAHETDPLHIADVCATEPRQHSYMKHMPHHMLEGFPLDWAKDCVNIHLLRHPARVISSYIAKHDQITLDDIGYAQQLTVYEKLGGVIIDSADIRAAPEPALRHLCAEIGLTFDPKMLGWHPGPRRFDGIWAKHWYAAVHRSSGFAGPEESLPTLEGPHRDLLDAAMPIYEALSNRVLRLGAS